MYQNGINRSDTLGGMTQPMSGRRAEAARNDGAILDAARGVFLEDPGQPIAAVAARAGVGISALYKRYLSKDDLLRELARDGLTRFRAELEVALARQGDAWTIYCECLERVLASRSQALAQRLAGRFSPTAELDDLAVRTHVLFEELHCKTQEAGALRGDVSTADVGLLLEMLSAVVLPGPDGGAVLRGRYLGLIAQALRGPQCEPLSGRAATDEDQAARWRVSG